MTDKFDVTDESIIDILENNYANFGKYVNGTRGNVTLDGLKAVQRRVLLSVKDCDRGGKIGSSEVVSHCLNNYHPHGDSSIYDTLVRLVQKGFVIPTSNFGNADTFDPSEAAAYRYTSVKNHKEFSKGVFRFIDLVDTYENEYLITEPKYLPVPIPLALTTGSTGIGFGVSSLIPMFSAKSLFNALHADDPSLLKAPNGLFIVSGDVEQLWRTSVGSLQYGYKCYQQYADLEAKNVSIIEGPGRYFSTNVKDIFEQHEAEGSVTIRDESAKRTRVAIARVKNIKRITDEEVHALAQQASVNQMYFRICINEDGVTKRISMRDWMQKLWTVYDDIVERYKTKQIQRIEHKIKIINLIPKAVPLIQKNTSVEEIAEKLKVDKELIVELESGQRSLRTLRKTEFEKEIVSLKEEIQTVSKLKSKTLAQDVVDVLEQAQIN